MNPLDSSLCLPTPATVQELFSVARDASIVPDISMDPVLISFLSLDSSASLQHQYTSLQRSMSEEQRAAFHLNLTGVLGGSSRVSCGGVGVIALALSILFDLVAQQVRMQGSFFEEPYAQRQAQMILGISGSSRIGWIIHSYLCQIPGIANNKQKMSETTELYDNWLKLELLDHYERMTNKKKRMSSESMRQWLAGAAVHLHIRIHQVRLHSVPPGSAESLRLSYKSGLARLVKDYTAYLRRNIQETAAPGAPGSRGSLAAGPSPATANTSGIPNVTCSHSHGLSTRTIRSSSRRLGDVIPVSPSGSDQTHKSNSTNPVSRSGKTNGSSEAAGLNVSRGGEEAAAVKLSSETVNMSTGCRRLEEAAGLGLLVIEPLSNVSHRVQHRPCESPAIEQALVTRIIDAQDWERNRDFFLFSEKLFHSLISQSNDFELKTK